MEFLRGIPSDTFDAGVTDGPYEIGVLGNKWDKTGIAYRVDFWREYLRVLKPGARLLSFSYPRTYHRMACAIEDAGFQIDDLFVWLKGGANMPKGGWVSPAIDKHLGRERVVVGERTLSGTAALTIKERGGTHSVGVDSRGAKRVVPVTESASDEAKNWDGWAWNLKGSMEPICFARKPPEGSAVASLLTWGTGALNVTACAIPAGQGTTRWPPNVALDNSAAVQLSLLSGETKCGANKNPSTSSGAFHGTGKRKDWTAEMLNKGDSGTAERYFPKFTWCRKANALEKVLSDGATVPASQVSVKPNPLMEYLVRLVCPLGGAVLDPFAGSGSTLMAGAAVGVDVYGIELDVAHYEFAMKRTGALEWQRICHEAQP
jgi:site-specific DNA-methyltransferase (adenine-specific)